jgi:hypothetical protein
MKAIFVALVLAIAASAAAQHEHPVAQHPATGAHRHPEAAKIANPVAATAASIGAGEKL